MADPIPPAVAALAAKKKLPAGWLANGDIGLTALPGGAVGIPYRDDAGEVAFTRRRNPDGAKERFLQPAKVKLTPYGRHRLGDARKHGELILCEGESDAWTLWHHGFHALALPGSQAANALDAEDVSAIGKLHILPDNDDAGAKLADALVKRLESLDYSGRLWLASLPAGVKDVSELHIADPDAARGNLQEILDGARRRYFKGDAHDGPGAAADSTPADAPWPVMCEDAYHGLAGEIVRAIEPETEADPVAILVQLLVAFGNAVGRLPFFLAEGMRHYPVLFAVIVGNTAKGRKGTSWGRVRQVMEAALMSWSADCIKNGLVSGEGLIHEVRDAKGEDEGILDKRLLVIESEFASVIRACGRDGSTLSQTIRAAWDGGTLCTMAKTSPSKATGAHVSVIGHITEAELRRGLAKGTETVNGFANRFLWVCARRSKLLPNGGRHLNAAALGDAMQKAIAKARCLHEIGWTDAGNRLWCELYMGELNEERGGGIYDGITARSSAQARRLAMMYALLDGEDCIDEKHLRAGMAVWRYCDQSAFRIFPESPAGPLATRLHGTLKQRPAGMTKSEITLAMKNAAKVEDVDKALQELLLLRMARCDKAQTGGRPSERWYAVA